MLIVAQTHAERRRKAATQAWEHRLAWAESAQAEAAAVDALVKALERVGAVKG
jgi:hypothetical protein